MTRYPVNPARTRLLIETGEAIYGTQYYRQMARDLDYNARSVQRWLNGDNAVPPFVWPQIIALIHDKQARLTKLRIEITKLLDTTEGTET